MGSMSKTAAKLGAALAAAFATQQVVSRSLAAFSAFDKGLIGVQKTTGMTDKQIKSLGVSISEMSLGLPVSTSRLLELAEAAGQLGVTGSKNIEIFTETMAKLETASDVAGEEGAKAIARLLNVTGEAINTVPRFGSVLVALGNASAASEKEILSLASEIGQATSVFSVTAADAAALGAAMRSMGVRAELGGSSVGRAMRTIEAAIHAGGAEMKLLMDVTQMTEKQLRETFERNATAVFQKWIEGIGRLVDGGRTAASVLEDFGLKGEEVLKVLPAMAQNSQLLADSLAISNAEVENATALNEEAMAASKSFSAQMGMTKNAVDLIAASIGAGLAPAIIDVVGDFRDWVDANDEFIRQGIPALVGETAEKLAQVQPLVEGVATATWRMVDGFLSLPTWVQSVGIISAFFFGKKAAIVLATLSAVIGQLKELNAQFDAIPQSSKLEVLIEREQAAIEKLNKQYKDLRGADKETFGQKILDQIAEREERLQGYTEMLEKAKDKTEDFDKATGDLETTITTANAIYDFDFSNWADGLDEVTDDTNELTDAMKRAKLAAESLKDLQVQAALDTYFEDFDNYAAALHEKEQMTIKSEESMKEIRIQAALDTYFEDIDNYEQNLKEKAQAEEKARQEYEREWERVYDDMHRFAADTFYDIFDGQLDSFEDFTDEMLNIFKRMLANMMAEAAMNNIFAPMMNSMAGSTIGSFFGLPSTSSPGINMTGASSIWDMFSGDGSSWMNMLPSGWVNPAYQGPGMGAAVAPASLNWTGIGTSIGTAAVGGLFSYVGIKLAEDIINLSEDKPAISFAVHNPEDPEGYFPGSGWAYGMKSSEFGYRVGAKDTDADSEFGQALFDYFDALFTGIEETTGIVMDDVLNRHIGYIGSVEGSDIQALSNNVFSELLPSLMMELFPDAETVEKEFQYLAGHRKTTGGGREGNQTIYEPFYDTVTREVSVMADTFNEAFFDAITPEDGTRWDAFTQFANVVENTTDFMEQFTRQMEEFGLSTVDAYNNIVTISEVMAQVQAELDAVNSVQTIDDDLNGIDLAFEGLIATLESVHATVEDVTEAERARDQVLGARITGLTGASIADTLKSGGDLSSILEQSIVDTLAAETAESIMDSYISELNETLGVVWRNTEDMDAVMAVLDGYDLSGAADEIQAFQDEVNAMFGELTDEVGETLEDAVEDARDALDRAIDAEWDLINARLSAADSISSLIDDLMGSDYNPVQSLEYYQQRYADLMADVQGATTADEISAAVDALTSFVPDYLDFAQAYGGSDYAQLFDSVMADLRSIEDDQRTEAQRQIDELQSIDETLGIISEDVLSISVALERYLAAVDAAGGGGGTTDPITPDPGGETPGEKEYDRVMALYESIGRGPEFGSEPWQIDREGYDYWTAESQWRDFPDLATAFYDAVEEYMDLYRGTGDPYADYLEEQGFASGAIISGPMSGYKMPEATYHGPEMIVPLNGTAIPVVVQNDTSESIVTAIRDALAGSGGGTINLNVTAKIGTHEFRGLVMETIKVDPETQRQIRRVANA
jgi:TP901 family phage tail tape measure protein